MYCFSASVSESLFVYLCKKRAPLVQRRRREPVWILNCSRTEPSVSGCPRADILAGSFPVLCAKVCDETAFFLLTVREVLHSRSSCTCVPAGLSAGREARLWGPKGSPSSSRRPPSLPALPDKGCPGSFLDHDSIPGASQF